MATADNAATKIQWKPSLARATRRLVLALLVLYAAGLACFLVLRAALGDHLWWLALASNFTAHAFLPLGIALPLSAVLSGTRVTRVLLAEAALGLWWFGGYYLPSPAAPGDGTPLRVVTFNVWGPNPQHARVRTWLGEAQADIVVLQEVTERRYDALVAGLSGRYPNAYAHKTPEHVWMNALLSRYPITSWENVVPADPCGPIQRFTVRTGDRTFAVYAVHLAMPLQSQPGATWRGHRLLKKALAYDDSLRDRQIAALLARIDRETLPFVVAGDFNLSDQSLRYQSLRARMGDAFRAAGSGPGSTWPANRELPLALPALLRIDYVWHSSLLRPVAAETGPPLGSDHLPVVADFVIPSPSRL